MRLQTLFQNVILTELFSFYPSVRLKKRHGRVGRRQLNMSGQALLERRNLQRRSPARELEFTATYRLA
jgi:hypothetical protein